MIKSVSLTKNSLLGKTADITIDRKLGSRNIRHKNIVYRVNIGYLAAEKGAGQKKHTVYIIGAENTSDTFEGMILATIRHHDNNDLLLVAAPVGKYFYEPQIRECLNFYERQYQSDYEFYMEKVCGIILWTKKDGIPKFLLIENKDSGHIGFPKGHIEFGESERETAEREVLEETGICVSISENFRTEYTYNIEDRIKKRAVYFIAEYNECIPKLQNSEISGSWCLSFKEAVRKLNYPQDIIVLMEAKDFYDNKRKSIENM